MVRNHNHFFVVCLRFTFSITVFHRHHVSWFLFHAFSLGDLHDSPIVRVGKLFARKGRCNPLQAICIFFLVFMNLKHEVLFLFFVLFSLCLNLSELFNPFVALIFLLNINTQGNEFSFIDTIDAPACFYLFFYAVTGVCEISGAANHRSIWFFLWIPGFLPEYPHVWNFWRPMYFCWKWPNSVGRQTFLR